LNIGVLFVHSSGNRIVQSSKRCFVMIAVAYNEINRHDLEKEKQQQIKMASDEKKDVSQLLIVLSGIKNFGLEYVNWIISSRRGSDRSFSMLYPYLLPHFSEDRLPHEPAI